MPMEPLMNTDKQKGAAKTARAFGKSTIRIVPAERLKKPEWIRVKSGTGECFGKGTATFMILGDLCTRRCPFCDVAHGRPLPPDDAEPANLAATIAALRLRYVVITSVDRDDLRDGGAGHFAACIRAVRVASPATRIEVLVPAFRGRLEVALDVLAGCPPDVMNHNLETVPRLYRQVRPGADYRNSLRLLKEFKTRVPHI